MDKDEIVSIKTIRMRECDYLRISKLCKENEITQAKGIEMLLDNYSKIKEADFNAGEVKIMELTRRNILIEKEFKVLLELLDDKRNRIQQLQKQFLKVLEEKMELEEKINELEIRNKI